MRSFSFVTVDVFTDRRSAAIRWRYFPTLKAQRRRDAALARSSISVRRPSSGRRRPANNARVRIFNRTAEMPFAGHPNVGTGGCWPAWAGPRRSVALRGIAGLVEVRTDSGGVVTIAAPQPLSLQRRCGRPGGGLRRHRPERRRRRHASARRGIGRQFLRRRRSHARRTDARRARHHAFQGGARRLPAPRPSPPAALPLRSRRQEGRGDAAPRPHVFAAVRTIEDAATGSAATPLAALLLSLGTADKARYDITQGVEMGRPSLLACAAWRAPDGIRASVGGGCVPVLKGEISL